MLNASIYARFGDEDHSLKYYKLGKSEQNIFREHNFSLQRELSPIKYREHSFEKKILNQKLIEKLSYDSRTLVHSRQSVSQNALILNQNHKQRQS